MCHKHKLYLLILFFCLACGGGKPRTESAGSPWQIAVGKLTVNGLTVLEDLPVKVRLSMSGNTGSGAFLSLKTDDIGYGLQRWCGIKLSTARRLTGFFRMKPWWTQPVFVKAESALPPETEALLWQREDGRIGLLLPLLDDGYRFSLQGDSSGLSVLADNNLERGETGKILRGVYVALGDDPYSLVEKSFAAVVAALGTGKLRSEKTLPAWIDYLGWASWYAFGREVNEDKFLSGLESLKKAGIRPGFVLLDDGWESVNADKRLLSSFAPDPKKFPHDLGWLVNTVTRDFGVRYFLIWHTLEGYWSGIDSLSPEMKKYPAYPTDGRSNRPMPERYKSYLSKRWNTVRPEAIEKFFFDYHEYLAVRGVVGVKVDNQSDLGYMTYGIGPMTSVMGDYIHALENSVAHSFGPGSQLNCMSLVTDALYQYRLSSVTRTSTDFFPDIAGSWGPHLVFNAYNSFIWGQIIQPDWDMFKSVHPWAAFHAAARAISGGPVYCSDEPGKHDPALLGRLVLPDGRVLRCPGPAVPTQDILFRDPQTEDILLKMFNTNSSGTFILAAFNCRYQTTGQTTVTDTLSAGLVHGIRRDLKYAVRDFGSDETVLRGWAETWPLTLAPGEFRIYTVSPVDKGVAPLGRTDMYNGGGILTAFGWRGNNVFTASLLAGGQLAFYCEKTPRAVKAGNKDIDFTYDKDRKLLTIKIDTLEAVEVSLKF